MPISRLMLMLALVLSCLYVATSAEENHDDNPLEKHMEVISANYKKLRRQARRQQFDAKSLVMVQAMQTHALAAMHEPFEMASEAPAQKRPKMILAYRKEMAKLIKTMLDLEISLLEKHHSKAQKLVSQLGRIKEDGHEQFKEED